MEKSGPKTIIGWIGTGVMGKSMCQHLLNRNYTLYVHTRTASKADDLIKSGATFMDPMDMAKVVDVLVLMLGHPQEVRDMVLDNTWKRGLLSHMKKGSILIDHTTSSPALACEIERAGREFGVGVLDAPVSGGESGAKNGTLSIMVGGDDEIFNKSRDVLNAYGNTLNLMGAAGTGQHTKVSNQIAIAGAVIGVVESLMYSYKAGLDPELVLKAISKGAAASFTLSSYGPKILARDFEPGFYVEHYVKDLEIALDECRRLGICLPGLAMVHQLYKALVAAGGGKSGTQALIKVLEDLNKTTIDMKSLP